MLSVHVESRGFANPTWTFFAIVVCSSPCSSFSIRAVSKVQIGDCKFGEWADDAKLHGIENLEKFRKAGKYRLHLDKTGMRGSEVRVVGDVRVCGCVRACVGACVCDLFACFLLCARCEAWAIVAFSLGRGNVDCGVPRSPRRCAGVGGTGRLQDVFVHTVLPSFYWFQFRPPVQSRSDFRDEDASGASGWLFCAQLSFGVFCERQDRAKSIPPLPSTV